MTCPRCNNPCSEIYNHVHNIIEVKCIIHGTVKTLPEIEHKVNGICECGTEIFGTSRRSKYCGECYKKKQNERTKKRYQREKVKP